MKQGLRFCYLPAEQARQWWAALRVAEDGPLLHEPHLRVARALVHEWHGRHLGIMPPEAAWLTRLLFFPTELDQPPRPWAALCARLEAMRGGADEDQAGLAARAKRGVLLPARKPRLSLMRLFEPLWRKAQSEVGETRLFCEDEGPAPVSAEELTAYRERLHAALALLVTAEATRGLFEETLWLLLDEQATVVRRLDPLGPRLLDALAPVLPQPAPLSLKSARGVPRRARDRVRERSEEGYAGIHLTRRLQDVGNVLFSEFMQHRLVATDRLLNTGYLAFQRTPKRDRTHRTHIACLMPDRWVAPAEAALVRACWLEAALRFAYFSLAHERLATVFRFAFFNWDGAFAHHRTALSELDLSDWRSLPFPAFRREFLNRTGWPSFLFESGHSPARQAVPQLEEPLNLEADLAVALRRFWKPPAGDRSQTVTQLRLLVLPERVRTRGTALVHALSAGRSPKNCEVAVLWVPQSHTADWLLEVVGGGEPEVVSPPESDYQQLGGRLIARWLTWWKKERRGG
ncbi:hypothetical protein [Acanthopleuribacter pedis]|uniref:Uncharacterized protein n=1 Tax=Acanthopleuribacter pedis TaxID=442870 RepID=A0A8J7QGW2_9BACT|nr:hypothetical protein [Acanthopleuribacter pedis]MBO1319925.1 hypothetical protein [Acanthopleuribacter pedis]